MDALITYNLNFLELFLAAIVLHEVGHALLALVCGHKVWGVCLGMGSITHQGSWWQIRRWPIGVAIGLAFGDHKVTPLETILIQLGPLLLGLLLWPWPVGKFLTYLNLFNLLPIKPLDGWRIWTALRAQR